MGPEVEYRNPSYHVLSGIRVMLIVNVNILGYTKVEAFTADCEEDVLYGIAPGRMALSA